LVSTKEPSRDGRGSGTTGSSALFADALVRSAFITSPGEEEAGAMPAVISEQSRTAAKVRGRGAVTRQRRAAALGATTW